VKLLLDENLSPRLLRKIGHAYPGSLHVFEVGLHARPDGEIWSYAATKELILVSKDDDFRRRSRLQGPPPKVVWLNVRNAGTAGIAELLLARRTDMERFESQLDSGLLELS
jgi:predicted nuclease of predicted toxin-antitoxin system